MAARIADRVVAVTGGARGIGREIAEQLAAAGAQVAIGDVDAAAATATAAEIAGRSFGFELDVTATDSFRTFLADVESQVGPIDVLVNNAGVMAVGPFADESESATAKMLEINLHGVIRGVQLAAPIMRDRGGGHIVTIASAAARISPPGESAYAATKHGVLGYLTGVREEMHGSGVQFSVIMPGVVATELAAGTASGPLPMLEPADVARAVVRAINRPRFAITVPWYVGPLVSLVNLLPQAMRDAVLRQMVPNQVDSGQPSARADYERGLSESRRRR